MVTEFIITLVTDDDTDAQLFDITRGDGLRLAYVPATTNTIHIKKALKTLWPGCVVTFRD